MDDWYFYDDNPRYESFKHLVKKSFKNLPTDVSGIIAEMAYEPPPFCGDEDGEDISHCVPAVAPIFVRFAFECAVYEHKAKAINIVAKEVIVLISILSYEIFGAARSAMPYMSRTLISIAAHRASSREKALSSRNAHPAPSSQQWYS